MALINYPASVVTDREKLTAIYALEEKFRLDFNAKGAQAKGNASLKRAWFAFNGRTIHQGGSIFMKAFLPILQERNRLRDVIRRAAMSDSEYKAEGLKSDTASIDLNNELFGDRQVERKLASTIGSDNLDMLKGIKLPDLSALVPPDPFEDWTTYDEYDPASEITVAANKIEVRDMQHESTAYVRRAGMSFSDFDHLMKIYAYNALGSGQPVCFHGPSQGSNTVQEFINNGDGPCTMWYDSLLDYFSKDWGTGGTDTTTGNLHDTQLWPRITRVNTTWTMYVYNNAERTSLLDTLTYVCSDLTYSQLVSVGGREYGSTGGGSSFDYEDLDLQTPAAPAVSGEIVTPAMLIATGQI